MVPPRYLSSRIWRLLLKISRSPRSCMARSSLMSASAVSHSIYRRLNPSLGLCLLIPTLSVDLAAERTYPARTHAYSLVHPLVCSVVGGIAGGEKYLVHGKP